MKLAISLVILASIVSISYFLLNNENCDLECHTKNDKYIWLEELESEKATGWVKEQNQKTFAQFENNKDFLITEQALAEMFTSDKEIAWASVHGNHAFNLWRDGNHKRGIWQMATTDSYFSESPQWETLIDLDFIANVEGKNWYFKRAIGLAPDYKRFLILLSDGGKDAIEVREFDIPSRSFVKENQFQLAEGKHYLRWVDKDTILIAWHGGAQLRSGYAQEVRVWKRGTPIERAPVIYKADSSHSFLYADYDVKNQIATVYDIKNRRHILFSKINLDTLTTTPLPWPKSINIETFINGRAYGLLNEAWEHDGHYFAEGSLVSLSPSTENIKPMLVYKPQEGESIQGIYRTNSFLVLKTLQHIQSKIKYLPISEIGSTSTPQFSQLDLANQSTIRVMSVDEEQNRLALSLENFVKPRTKYLAKLHENSTVTKELEISPKWFAGEKYMTKQYFATSQDGTRVPYFITQPKDLKKYQGNHPVWLYGYGGFMRSMEPYYSGAQGKIWLEQGGLYVVANVRGGGEYGPKWHKSAIKENRERSFEDFIAVAEDLIARKITTPEHLGISGGSNGGLLVGAVTAKAPNLFKAAIAQVPLLDMLRYTKLPPGASWVGEYGDPEIPEEFDYIVKYSPYQNVKQETNYPRMFFLTSTKDDRVHPAHARKMAAKMLELNKDVLFYENTAGGHGGAASLENKARFWALQYEFMKNELF